jgi:hypothetical protein
LSKIEGVLLQYYAAFSPSLSESGAVIDCRVKENRSSGFNIELICAKLTESAQRDILENSILQTLEP